MSNNPHPPGTYENIIIGNFLVGFGLLMGYRHKNDDLRITEMCANLTQQQDWDKSIGDVLLEVAGTIRILEFKRASNRTTKERVKAELLTRALKIPALAQLEAISRSIHWYIETKDPEPQTDVRIIPYIDLLTDANTTQDLAAFVESTVRDACDKPVPPKQMDQYINYFRLLWRCQSVRSIARPGARSASSVPSTGALVVQLIGDGQLRYAATDDIRSIFLTKEQREAEKQEFKQELERLDLQMRHDLKQEARQEFREELRLQGEAEKSISHGMSMKY